MTIEFELPALPSASNGLVELPTASVESVPTAIDHVALGLSRLPAFLQEKPKVAALLTSWLNRSNELEAAAIAVLTLRNIDTATGQQLDDIGGIVGRARDGADDDTYRRYLRAQIAVNNSNGTVEDLLRIARLILNIDSTNTGHMVIRTIWDASLILEIRDFPVTDAIATILVSMLTQAASAGVRIIVEWSAVALASTFRLDGGPGLDVGHLARGVDAPGSV